MQHDRTTSETALTPLLFYTEMSTSVTMEMFMLALAVVLTLTSAVSPTKDDLAANDSNVKNVRATPNSSIKDAVPSSVWSYSTISENRHGHAVRTGAHEVSPYFQDETETNLTAQLGSTANLNCSVKRLRDKTVSWVRRDNEEIKLLTFGLLTYSNDERYSLNFEHPNNWKLQIKYTQRRDQGTYECQISTHPPRVRLVHLNIVAPVVEIIDERGANVQEKFYKKGSTIELRCTISQMPQAQTFILWKHEDHMLNYDTSRGGISVKTDMSSSVIVSTLFIANATPKDTGNYTCSLGDVASGNIRVHILNGETPAAMHHGSSGNSILFSPVLVLPLVLLTFTFIQR